MSRRRRDATPMALFSYTAAVTKLEVRSRSFPRERRGHQQISSSHVCSYRANHDWKRLQPQKPPDWASVRLCAI